MKQQSILLITLISILVISSFAFFILIPQDSSNSQDSPSFEVKDIIKHTGAVIQETPTESNKRW